MVTLELRDSGAGVVARSYRVGDFISFLRSRIRHKRQEATALKALDPTSATILEAEVRRLEELVSILRGRRGG